MTRIVRAAHVVSLVVVLAVSFLGQVPTGTPPRGSYGGAPFDVVNLGNLNVHFLIPILHKTGRGIPFAYDLAYNNSIWYPVTSNGVTSWKAVNLWGWQGLGPVVFPYVSYSVTYSTGTCWVGSPASYQQWTYGNFVYHDSLGTSHGFGTSGVYFISPGGGSCPPNGQVPASIPPSASGDGSGYTLNVSTLGSGGTPNGNITTAAGSTIGVSFFSSPPQATVPVTTTDRNGNQITETNGVYTDTLGTTALTATGTAPSNTLFTYTAPSGSPASYTVSYVTKTVTTNFGCLNINEYNMPNQYLVDRITLPDSTYYQFTYEPTTTGSSTVTGRLASVTLPTGGTISYTYSGGTGTGTNAINCVDGTTMTLSRITNPGGGNPVGTWNYARSQVSGAHWKTTVTDSTASQSQTAIHFWQDTSTKNFYETERQVYQGPSVGGTLLKTVYRCYNATGTIVPANCPTTAVTLPITRQTVFTYLPDSAGAESETDSTFDDDSGLIKEVDEYDYGSAVVGPLIRKTITTYTALGNGIVDRPATVVIKDASNNVKAQTTYTYDQTGTLTATSGVPQHVSVTGSRGNVTTLQAQVNGTTNVFRKFTYYDTGSLKASTDLSTSSSTNGALTTFNYTAGTPSCNYTFPTSVTEPLSLSRSMSWNCTGAVLLSLTDENNKIDSTIYTDSYFWRSASTTDNAGVITSLHYYTNPPQVDSTFAINGGSAVSETLTTLDGFGRRVLVQQRQGPTATYYNTLQTDYDIANCGPSRQTLPFSATSGQTSGSAPGSITSYDSMCRPSSASDSGGGVITYTYSKNDVYQSRGPAPANEGTKDKNLEYDALGRLKSVCEITSSANGGGNCAQGSPQTGYWTTYTYDVLGNTTSVVQNAQAAANSQQSRAYAYDMLGRITSDTNPETNKLAYTYIYDSLTSDPICGTVSGVTNGGDQVKRIDVAGKITCYQHDGVHRLTTVKYSDGTPEKHFIYDAATVNGGAMNNAKTRLAEAYTCTTCTPVPTKLTDVGFGYSPRGETSDVYETTPHLSGYFYHVTASYWEHGALKTLAGIPSVPTIYYGGSNGSGLDGQGRIASIVPSGQNAIASSVTYDTASHPLGITYGVTGSADSDSFGYDGNTGRVTSYQFSVGSPVKTDSGTVQWNQNGSLQRLTISDLINTGGSQVCNYSYDDLGRSKSVDCGASTWQQNFSYDAFGNLSKSVPPGGTGISSLLDYDLTKNWITTAPYTQDGNNGNLTHDNSHIYTWDPDGRVLTIDSGGANGVCITYDALGRAVEQGRGVNCNSSFTQIAYGPSGQKLALMNGQTLSKAFIPLVAGAEAVYNSSGVAYYRHPDWLGSSRLATTPARNPIYDVAYAPFGEPYAAFGSTQDLSFTGQKQDTASSAVPGGAGGLYDFLFREQSPVPGRWLSPDPAGLAAVDRDDPQTWNRYAYVRNTPTSLTDALGLLCDAVGGPVCGCDDAYGGERGEEDYGRVGGGESLGLPQGLNTFPVILDDLLHLLPGLSCGPGGSSGFGFVAVTPSGPSKRPCEVLLVTLASVLAQAPTGKSEDKRPPVSKCTPHRDYNSICDQHNQQFITGFSCEGEAYSKSCCLDQERIFTDACLARNTWGVVEYHPYTDNTLQEIRAACCRNK